MELRTRGYRTITALKWAPALRGYRTSTALNWGPALEGTALTLDHECVYTRWCVGRGVRSCNTLTSF